LDHAGQQTQNIHDHRKEKWGNPEQDRGNHRPAHDVAVEAHGQRDAARKFGNDIEGQHDE